VAPRTTTDRDTAAASGDSNQAVATTSADATTPAKGANSFTMDQARGRIGEKGFSNVTDLVKDEDGIWRGKAQKGGSTTTVWLDYKGNVGESR
jgi:putative membrane protein